MKPLCLCFCRRKHHFFFVCWFVRSSPFPFALACNLSSLFLVARSQTRHTCASALCKIALRLPEPVRFDAYCFLKGLVDAAAIFPLTAPLGGASATPESDSGSAGGGGGHDNLLASYRQEQEALLERVETGACSDSFGFIILLSGLFSGRCPRGCR